MDKKILIEYADMKEEIKDLRRRIAEDKKKIEQLNKITVQDSVACGKKGNKPLRTVKITGFPQREYEKREFFSEKGRGAWICRAGRRGKNGSTGSDFRHE